VVARISAEISPKDIARVKKRFDQNRGKPLAARLGIATRKAADLLRGPVAAASPVKTGRTRKSVKSGTLRARGPVEVAAGKVGPTSYAAHLAIRGHRIVTPGGRYLGRRTRPNDFVDRATAAHRAEVVRIVRDMAFI
jgi:hypothetical protein